jgi:hypothetical protein
MANSLKGERMGNRAMKNLNRDWFALRRERDELQTIAANACLRIAGLEMLLADARAGKPSVAPDTGDDSLSNVRRLRSEILMLRAVLKPFADLLVRDTQPFGGETIINPTIKVQMVRDAKEAMGET